MRNRLWNCRNPNQGTTLKVLTVCSAGLLRSPTLAHILSSDPYNFNTRAVGLDEGHALIPLDDVHLEWADVVFCMDRSMAEEVERKGFEGQIFNLSVPDNFEYRDPELVNIMKDRMNNKDIWLYRDKIQPED